MEFLSFLTSPPVALYSAALLVVVLVSVAELLLSVLLGAGMTDLLEAHATTTEFLPHSSITNWLLVRELPMLAVILALLAGFGVGGVAAYALLSSLFFGPALPAFTLFLAVLGAVLAVRGLAAGARRLRLVSTTALPSAEFIGQRATLVSPVARKGYAGEARFTDKHGYTHHVLVEPATDNTEFVAGDDVFIESQSSISLYKAIRA